MRKSTWLFSAGLIAISMPAYAQQTDTDAGQAQPTDGATAEAAAVDSQAIDTAPQGDTSDIVVTATRRNEALSDVPLAVSAVTAETLQNSGASDIRQLTQVSPSLFVSSTSSEAGAGGARIRGIGTVGDNPGLESSVAVFIDGVYRSRIGVGLTELGQVDRVEVLRGPQGTLFGRNASAGLISIITAKPKFKTEVSGEVTVGNYDTRRAELSLTGPVSDTIAARLDGVYYKRDGFLEDVISGRDVNNRDRYLLRGQMLFEPSSDLSFRLIADYSNRDEECCAASYLPARDVVGSGGSTVTFQPSTIAAIERGLGGIINDDTFSRDVAITPGRSFRSDVKDYGLSGELVYDFGGAELTSISAYRYNKYIRGQDIDFNNLDIFYRDDDGGTFNRFKTFTQELRLQGEAFGGRLDWLVGGYYAHEKLTVADQVALGTDYLRFANCIGLAGLAPQFLLPTPTGNCVNPTVFTAISQLTAGIAQLTAAINNPLTPPAAIPGLIAQRAALQAQLAQVSLISNGFTSIANAIGVPGPNPFAGVAYEDRFDQTSNNFAVFTHNIFDITDSLKLTVGARYTREKKKLEADLADNNVFCRALSTAVASPALAALRAALPLACFVPNVPGGSFSDSSSKTEGKLSGTVVLSYKPFDEVLTYLSYSRGYKAGGYNLDRASLPRVFGNGAICGSTATPGCADGADLGDLKFDPEVNDAFEVGMKYNGRGIDINVAAFHQLFDDFQLNTFNGVSFEVENINSCSEDLNGGDTDNSAATGVCTGKVRSGVRSAGVEFEMFTRPMRNVNFNLGGAYAVTRYRHNLVGADGEAISPQLFQLAGRQVSNAAEFTMTSSLSWTPPIGSSGLSALFYVDGRHMSTFNTGSDLDIEKTQEKFNVFNARVGLRGPNNNWAVELWAQNVFDKDFLQVAFDAPVQGTGTTRGVQQGFYPRSTQLFGAFLGEPRTYGLTLRAKFAPEARMPEVAPPAPLPPPPPPAMQTCPDGSMIEATAACPVPPPPPPPPPAGERG